MVNFFSSAFSRSYRFRQHCLRSQAIWNTDHQMLARAGRKALRQRREFLRIFSCFGVAISELSQRRSALIDRISGQQIGGHPCTLWLDGKNWPGDVISFRSKPFSLATLSQYFRTEQACRILSSPTQANKEHNYRKKNQHTKNARFSFSMIKKYTLAPNANPHKLVENNSRKMEPTSGRPQMLITISFLQKVVSPETILSWPQDVGLARPKHGHRGA